MLLNFDPFRDFDRLADQMLASTRVPRTAPMDVYRSGDHYVLLLDLPGVDPGSVDLTVENSTLTVRAERTARPDQGVQYLVSERPTGTFSRQLQLGEGLDAEAISATYDAGVLAVTIPVAEKAKPRKIEVGTNGGQKVIEGAPEDA
ncbi:MAG: Hsp20/alpha crystallin family protein [Actinomycetes bacterium]